MMEIKYPETLYCPSCKSEIRIDYSGKNYARTNDVLALQIEIPISQFSAKDAQKKKDLDYYPRGFIICQSCYAIIGTTK